MPRQNAATTGSAVNLRAAAQSIRATASSGTFDDLKAALALAASAFDNAQNAIEIIEARIRDLAQPNTNQVTRQAPMTVSGDRIRGGVQVQGLLQSVMGQGVDYTFTSQVGHITGFDHGTGAYLEVDIDGSPVAINGHSGGVTISGTVTLATPLPVPSGGTGTATGSITGTGTLTFTAGGGGRVALKPTTDSTTAIQAQNAAGAAVLDVDTTNSNVGIGVTPYSGAKLHVHTGTDGNLLFRPKIALATGIALHSIDDAIGVTKAMEFIGSTIYLNTATVLLALAGVPVFANNAAAVAGGLTAGMLYRTGGDPDPVSIVH